MGNKLDSSTMEVLLVAMEALAEGTGSGDGLSTAFLKIAGLNPERQMPTNELKKLYSDWQKCFEGLDFNPGSPPASEPASKRIRKATTALFRAAYYHNLNH